jgi:hypothetical protein
MTSGSTARRSNETLLRDLAGGGFLAQQRNSVLIGGTGTGKTHLAIAIARSNRFESRATVAMAVQRFGRSGPAGDLCRDPAHAGGSEGAD